MGALLVGLAAAGILMSVALPVWSQAARREREAELVFRGEQYARAVALYQRTYAGAFPPDIETLIEERFLRRRYRDPMVEAGEFRILRESELEDLSGAAPDGAPPGELAQGQRETVPRPTAVTAAGGRSNADDARGGVVGVASVSSDASIRVYNGATRYDQWIFLYSEASAEPGSTAGAAPDAAPDAPVAEGSAASDRARRTP